MEKTLAATVKGHDEAIAARDEAQKREEDLRASVVAREKLFEEQLFSIAKALSGTLLGYHYCSLFEFVVSADFRAHVWVLYRCWRFELRPSGPPS